MKESTPKRGRPFKSDADRRDATPLYIKLTHSERELIERAGGENPSVWAREAIIRAAKRAKP